MADLKYNKIYNYLKSLNFHFQKNWVNECVDYYENINPNMSEIDLKSEVRQQWLLLNLRDMKVPSFPPNIKEQNKVVLTGRYAVQVETLVDSGASRYSQLQACRKDNCDNVKATSKPEENEASSRRCITMTITDGVQDLYAMEYELIPCLKLNDPDLLPGFKAIIKGPVTCRKGMLLLKPINLDVCGGEVDSLVEKNRYESLLMRSLGCDNVAISSHLTKKINVDTSSSIRMLNENDDDLLMEVELFENESSAVSGSSQLKNIHSIPNNGCDDIDFPEDDMILNLVDEREFLNFSNPVLKSKPAQSTINQFLMPKPYEESKTSPPKSLHAQPFIYLDQIVNICLCEDCEFRVKAIIITLKTKITVQGDAFSLQAKICDGSLAMDVLFSSGVLEDLLGFSPSELSLLLKEKMKNSAVGERIRSAFTNAQEQLISLNCILNIKFFANSGIPLILSLESITQDSLKAIKLRNN